MAMEVVRAAVAKEAAAMVVAGRAAAAAKEAGKAAAAKAAEGSAEVAKAVAARVQQTPPTGLGGGATDSTDTPSAAVRSAADELPTAAAMPSAAVTLSMMIRVETMMLPSEMVSTMLRCSTPVKLRARAAVKLC